MINIQKNIQVQMLLPILIVLIGWCIVFFPGITTAIDVWSVSEIYTHCFLVIPCSIYFIFQKRHQIISQTIKPNYWILPFIIATLLIQLFGYIGDIKLFMHIATFSALPLIIWMVLGNKAAKEITFPLFLIVLSIPVGDQLIPYLQDITTNMAVPLLELSNVPVYRKGYYLDIPEGRFLVAEACSGISFLIASFVFGCLYAYVSFTRLSKQLIFVVISILVPIFANSLRVYGIILTAHLTDMEYAAGADHIIYGGIFYSFIIFLLIVIGEKFRDKKLTQAIDSTGSEIKLKDTKKIFKVVGVIVAVFAIQLLWKAKIENQKNVKVELTGVESHVEINLTQIPLTINNKLSPDWKPNYVDAAATKQGQIITHNQEAIDYYIASYGNTNGELVADSNYLFNTQKWSLLNKETLLLNDLDSAVVISKLVSSTGVYRYIAHWYDLSNKRFTSEIKVKLTQTSSLLQGKSISGAVFAFSLKETSSDSKRRLINFINDNSQYFYLSR